MEESQTTSQAVLAEKQQLKRVKDWESKKGEWSDGAISCLLDAYETKWNKRNRGNLRVGDWEEVSIFVSSRCNGFKTSTQCKNKIEGMKKRYRLEAMDSCTARGNGASSWPFFARMDSLLHVNNKSVMEALSRGLDPGGLGLGLGFSEFAGNDYGDEAVLHSNEEAYDSQAAMYNGRVGYAKQVALPADGNGATTLLCVDDIRQVPFSHMQLLEGNGDLRGHAFFPDEDDHQDERDGGLQEAESKHEARAKTLFQGKKDIETNAHGCKLAQLPVDVAAAITSNACRSERKLSAKQKKHVHNEVLASIQTFADSILKLEHTKMEMYKDAERLRAESEARRADLELRRTQMIMNTQLEIAKLLVANSSSGKKKMKKNTKRKEKKVISKVEVNFMNGEDLQTSLEQVQQVEGTSVSHSASGNDHSASGNDFEH